MPEITHSSTLAFKSLGFKHRVGEPQFKHLFQGTEGQPENYLFTLASQPGKFYSPIHKHNFDQFRYAYKGSFSLTSTFTLQPGELSYHPEGVEYGPQNDPDDGQERVCLVLQFGGASGQGYMSYDRLLEVQAELATRGTFEGGKFYANSKDGGEGVDGFQAVWEECNGRPLVYPTPRFEAPVFLKPQNFEWKEVLSAKGGKVLRKHLGSYTERETRVELLRIENGGELKVSGQRAVQLGFIVDGEGVLGDEKLVVEDAFKLQPGESATIVSDSQLNILHFVLPILSCM